MNKVLLGGGRSGQSGSLRQSLKQGKRWLLGAALITFCATANAFLFPQFSVQPVPQLKNGVVMTRAQVIGENGGPILVVTRTVGSATDASTTEIEEIGEVYPESELDGTYILSGAEVGYYLDKYARLRIERGETMQRAVFLDAEALAEGLPVANGATSETVHYPDTVKTVLVLGERDRFGTDPARWTLLEIPFLMNEDTTLQENISSVLFDPEGNVLRAVNGTTDENGNYAIEQFTYRVGYFGEGEEAVEQADYYRPKNQDRIFGPVSGAELEFMLNPGVSGGDGRYQLFYLHYCLGLNLGGEFVPVTDPIDTKINLILQASIYRPNGQANFPMLMQQDTMISCTPDLHIAQNNFVVDLLWLRGKLRLANTPNGEALPVGDETLYAAESRQGDPLAQSSFDFDGDGEPDVSVLANKKTETDPETEESYVIPDQEGEDDSKRWQAVYFSSGSKQPDAEDLADQVPDLWRLADHTLDAEETGLLTQISQDTLVNTDVYIFNEGTGDLIVELNGLPEGSGDGRDVVTGETGGAEDHFAFNTVIRGPKQNPLSSGLCKGQRGEDCLLRTLYDGSGDEERSLISGYGDTGYQQDAEQLGFSSRFQQRDSGLPSPGDWLYVVAINRTTGYTGTTRFQLGQSYGQGASGPSITQIMPDITLTPPNLKVWAKRVYDIEKGLTKDETVNYLIGHEGAATQNDTLVGIYTEWLDSEGRPLPTGLDINQGKDFGLSGRLAKISGDALTPVTSGVAVESDDFDIETAAQSSKVVEFPIGPGQRLQILRLKADNTSNEHYYLNVFGRAINKEACSHCEYDETDKQQDLLTGRPNHYTPFYVPRYDEQATLELKLERNKLRIEEAEAQEEGAPPPDDEDEDKLGKVDAQYDWMLRPEYQFTLLDIEINELNAVRTETNEDGSETETVRNLLEQDQPVITSSDDLIRLLYSLILPEDDALQSLDGPREYVLALGEEEVRITAGEDQTLDIENIEHLAALDVEDFLTMRLYLSNDQENVLWQWAFEYLYLDTEDTAYNAAQSAFVPISADDVEVDVQAILVGYYNRDDAEKKPVSVKWSIAEGSAQLESREQTDAEIGAFYNVLTLPTQAGSSAVLKVELADDPDAYSEIGPFMVYPGEPDFIQVSAVGDMSQEGHGTVNVTVSAYDAYMNPVADGTNVDVQLSGGLVFSALPESTVDGAATFSLKGADVAGDFSALIRVGNKVRDENFSVLPLEATFVSVPSEMQVGGKEMLSLQVRDHTGAFVPDVDVFVYGDGVFVDNGALTTNASGIASAAIYATMSEQTALLKARIGTEQVADAELIVSMPDESVRTDYSAVVGDGPDSERLMYERFDGLSIALEYTEIISAEIAGGTSDVDVTLGSLLEPNRSPLVKYSLSEALPQSTTSETGEVNTEYLLTDDSGLLHVRAEDVESVSDSSFGPYADSLKFYGISQVRLPREGFSQVDEPGMRLDFKPEMQGGIFDYGPVSIDIDSGGRVLARIDTDQGSFSVSSDGIAFNEWHRLGVAVENGVLFLQVDERIYQEPIMGDLAWRVARPQVGDLFFGNMRSLVWYDTASAPLLLFDGGGETNVSNSEGVIPDILSTGSLNLNGAYPVAMHNVELVSEGVTTQSRLLSVSSSERYIELVGTYAAFFSSANIPQVGEYTPSVMPYGMVLETAYANDVVDFGLATGKFILDVLFLDSVKVIFNELGKIGGDEDIEWVSLGLAVVTLVPIFKVLKVADRLAPLFARALTVASRSPAAIKWLGVALMKTVDLALAGKFDRLLQLAPFVLIGAQLSADEEVLDFLLSDIESSDDVFAMLEYFTFPADGWEGIGPPPGITLPLGDLVASTNIDALKMESGQWVATTLAPEFNIAMFDVVYRTGLIEPAHAAGVVSKVGMLPAALIGTIRGALQRLPASALRNARQGRGTFRALVASAKSTQSATVRKWLMSPTMIFNAKMLARISVLGSNGLKKMMIGWRNARVSITFLMAAISYIETRMSEREIGGDEIEKYDNKFDELLRAEINKKYLALVATAGNLREETLFTIDAELKQVEAGNTLLPEITSRGHGEVFHLMMLAYYMALEEAGGEPVKGIEMRRSVWLYETAEQREKLGKTHARFTRRVDIVLGEQDVTGAENWIELKSYSARNPNARPRYTPNVGLGQVWNMARGSRSKTSALHRQFVVDRIAEKHGALVWKSEYKKLGLVAPVADSGRVVELDSMQWWFQKFDRKVRQRNSSAISKISRSIEIGGPRNNGSVMHLFKQLPTGDSRLVKYNVGSKLEAASFSIYGHVKVASAFKLFLSAAKEVGKDVLVDAALNDVDVLE